MQPLRLSIKNFCGHLETEFSFDDFSSALIIGKVKDNDRFSNGAGKSTIFNAIEYVLFNEVHFSALEKVIRDGCDVCRVEFDFISSLDKSTYRIVRSNSRKTGTDVRLSKMLDGNEWEDLTQRRVSDTEKEIIKIVGFNYKAFCASVLFSQFGSENNVQKDYGNLPYLTPEKRKSVLREVLQLHVYSNYEKLAKSKYNALSTSLEKQKIILNTLGESEEKLPSLTKDKANLEKALVGQNEAVKAAEQQYSIFHAEYTILVEKLTNFKNKISELKAKEFASKDALLKSKKSISDIKEKISSLPTEAKKIKNDIEIAENKLSKLKESTVDQKDLKSQLDNIISAIIANRAETSTVSAKIQECKKPITSEKICSSCHQSVSEDHKHNWQTKVQEELTKYESVKKTLDNQYEVYVSNRSKLEKTLNAATDSERQIMSLQSTINSLNKDIESKRLMHSHYSSLLIEHVEAEKNRMKELEDISLLLKEMTEQSSGQDTAYVEDIKSKALLAKSELSSLTDVKNKLTNNLAVLNHQIEVCIANKQKIIEIKNTIQDLEKSLLIYSKVVQAFGSNGIPALITHSILDELQEEANKWLLKLRPGLQLQFVVANDKNNKEKEDTLDILYFIDGNQREYKQLSGAQKIIVSLSIKLALLFVMNKRLGVDIKLILLDEVDQALDPGSTEIFADIIRVIQDDFKVIVITHDDDIKHKFSHAILVEQDENNVSRGRLINW